MRKKAISLFLSMIFATTIIAGCSSAKDVNGTAGSIVQSQQSENKNNASDADKDSSDNIDSEVQSADKDSNKDENQSSENTQSQNTEKIDNIDILSFAVNGSFKTVSSSNDLGEDVMYLRGNGNAYQIIGTTGKGAFVKVYNVKDSGIYEVFSDDIDDKKLDKLADLDYLDKSSSKETLVLKAPVKVGTRWGNKEIVEVGKDLKVDNVTYKGAYAKVWERKDSSTTKVSYYCEGYGCVKYNVIQDKTTISYFKYSNIK